MRYKLTIRFSCVYFQLLFLPYIFSFCFPCNLFILRKPQRFFYFLFSPPTYHGWSSVRYSLGLWFVAVYFSPSHVCLCALQCNISLLIALWRCFIPSPPSPFLNSLFRTPLLPLTAAPPLLSYNSNPVFPYCYSVIFENLRSLCINLYVYQNMGPSVSLVRDVP